MHRPLLALTLLSPAILAMAATPQTNPFFREWKTPFQVPPFREIAPEHFMPAFKEGMARQKQEVQAILRRKSPTFANTIAALDDSGVFLDRVNGVFGNLTAAETNEKLQAIEREVAPLLSRHSDDIRLNADLFQRIKAVHDARAKLRLKPEEARLLEKTYQDFVRNGALLQADQQERLRAINAELSVLTVTFGENLLKETNGYRRVLDRAEDLEGLPAAAVSAAAEAARKAGLEGKWVVTLHAPSYGPFLKFAKNRALRQELWTAYRMRCDKGDALDNKAVLTRIAALRVQKAKLLGFPTWADYTLDARMAKTPAAVLQLMDQVWTPALARAKAEAKELEALLQAELPGAKLEPWDWSYYAEKLKMAKYDLDEESLRPYFQLDKVREGAFRLAGKLYGITFTERKDVPTYHEEVKAFEVKEKDGRTIGLFYVDYHPRPGKRGGAWMENYRTQWIQGGRNVTPIVTNVGNFSRPVDGKPALITLGEAETLFHEFGHGLHGLLSRCRFRGLASPNVLWDFVELPSQIMEHWVVEPEMLKDYARHYQTGEAMPDALVAKIQKAKHFNQGFATVAYTASARLDLEWHLLTEPKEVDPEAFEKAVFAKIGLIPEVTPYHRTPAFRHIFSGGYAAGYYSYQWAQVLDADAFEAFKEKGNIFDPATAKSFRENILQMGNTEDPMTLYTRFRGREPKVEALLKDRGLL